MRKEAGQLTLICLCSGLNRVLYWFLCLTGNMSIRSLIQTLDLVENSIQLVCMHCDACDDYNDCSASSMQFPDEYV